MVWVQTHLANFSSGGSRIWRAMLRASSPRAPLCNLIAFSARRAASALRSNASCCALSFFSCSSFSTEAFLATSSSCNFIPVLILRTPGDDALSTPALPSRGVRGVRGVRGRVFVSSNSARSLALAAAISCRSAFSAAAAAVMLNGGGRVFAVGVRRAMRDLAIREAIDSVPPSPIGQAAGRRTQDFPRSDARRGAKLRQTEPKSM